jgi:hypothetical protein
MKTKDLVSKNIDPNRFDIGHCLLEAETHGLHKSWKNAYCSRRNIVKFAAYRGKPRNMPLTAINCKICHLP